MEGAAALTRVVPRGGPFGGFGLSPPRGGEGEGREVVALAGTRAPSWDPSRASAQSGFHGRPLSGIAAGQDSRHSRGQAQRRKRPVAPRAAEIRTEQKVRVVLGPYKDGSISVSAPALKVGEEEIRKALEERKSRTHTFERINFTGTGAAIGHTVKLNFEGKYAAGPMAGQLVKGTKAAGYELELKERDDEPWRTFVKEITVAGMGQEESKTFRVVFPKEYKAKALAGVEANFTVTVKAIGVKHALETDSRPEAEQREEVERELRAAAERQLNEVLDAAIRASLLASSEADVQKVADSVTWAKFGEKSLQDYKWNVLQEEVARVEGLQFDAVMPFLRSQAKVSFS